MRAVPRLVLWAAATLSAAVVSFPVSAAPEVSQAPEPDKMEDARRRYQNALELFNEGSYDAALLEFRRAYSLAPSFRILYNIALVNLQLNDYAQTLEYFERYLREGGADVPRERAEEVQREIARLSGRVATLEVTADVLGAEVFVDDLPIGKTPFPYPIRVNAGRRRVSLKAQGRPQQSRIVEVAGGDAMRLSFELGSSAMSPDRALVPRQAAPVKGRRAVPWIGWIATGVLAAGAVTTGVLALDAQGDLVEQKSAPNPDENALDDTHARMRTFSITADILTGAAVIAGSVTLYFTLKSPRSTSGQHSPLRIGVGSRGVTAVALF